jgi:hypothetical protein
MPMAVVIHIRNRQIGSPIVDRSNGRRRLKSAVAVAKSRGHLLRRAPSSPDQIRNAILIEIT